MELVDQNTHRSVRLGESSSQWLVGNPRVRLVNGNEPNVFHVLSLCYPVTQWFCDACLWGGWIFVVPPSSSAAGGAPRPRASFSGRWGAGVFSVSASACGFSAKANGAHVEGAAGKGWDRRPEAKVVTYRVEVQKVSHARGKRKETPWQTRRLP